jgi:hypothetical protein
MNEQIGFAAIVRGLMGDEFADSAAVEMERMEAKMEPSVHRLAEMSMSLNRQLLDFMTNVQGFGGPDLAIELLHESSQRVHTELEASMNGMLRAAFVLGCISAVKGVSKTGVLR